MRLVQMCQAARRPDPSSPVTGPAESQWPKWEATRWAEAEHGNRLAQKLHKSVLHMDCSAPSESVWQSKSIKYIWFWDTDWFGKYLERLAWCAWWSNFCSFCQCVYSSDLGFKNHQVASKRKNVRRKGSLVTFGHVWSRLVTFGHVWPRLATFSRKHVTRQPVAIWSECISQIGTPQWACALIILDLNLTSLMTLLLCFSWFMFLF